MHGQTDSTRRAFPAKPSRRDANEEDRAAAYRSYSEMLHAIAVRLKLPATRKTLLLAADELGRKAASMETGGKSNNASASRR